jgi:hypothetical protein
VNDATLGSFFLIQALSLNFDRELNIANGILSPALFYH